MLALVLGAALALVAVLLVARPFLREPAPVEDRIAEPGELDRRRVELVEERDRALGALKELLYQAVTLGLAEESAEVLTQQIYTFLCDGCLRVRGTRASLP